MKDMNNFSNNIYDLGFDTEIGLTKTQVDEGLKRSQYDTGHRCIVCNNTAQYKLLPKSSKYNSADIQERGYVCNHCLNVNSNINKNHYGIRELK